MLKLGDFFHLPQLDPLVEQMVTDGPGLIVIAGLDPRLTSVQDTGDAFLPSGRSAIFGILMREIMAAHPSMRAVIVTEDKAVIRISRQLRRRVQVLEVRTPLSRSSWVLDGLRRRPDLIVLDRLCADSAPAALQATQQGVRVLAQLDTVFRGATAARQLLDWGVTQAQLTGLTWVLAVQRLATLCPRCKHPIALDSAQLAELHQRYPQFEDLAGETEPLFRAQGCSQCRYTGRQGSIAAFDVFRAGADPVGSSLFEQASLLSLEEYVLNLVTLGHLPLEDLLRLGPDQLRRTYNLLSGSERGLADANVALTSKLVELEAAHRVLQQRTEALISLQDIGQALITSNDLNDLATRVCRRACDLCGADRAILYFRRTLDEGNERAEILAVGGWDSTLVGQQVDLTLIFDGTAGSEPKPFRGWPPGVLVHSADDKDIELRASLRVPLVAQGERVGLMIVHSTQKPSFKQGEVALLQTAANQAAVAIQRASLIEELRSKIVQLEAAQAELVQKERMERELELARQVQQSVLPRAFPQVEGYAFAAKNEPARQVGGDLYDVFSLDKDRFGLVIADVSDKGMPAALYMALTRSLLLAEARRERAPRAVLVNVNRLLRELGEPDMFVSVFYGVVEGPAQRLTYTRAGHDRPLLLREGTLHSLGGKGAVLGFLEQEELHLSEEQIGLAPGDRLVLYTDGLTDVVSPDDQLFGLQRLESLLQSHAHLSPREICTATFADLETYQGSAEQFDDMTMLVMGVD